ncbi:MAG: hypothetical protein NWS66_05780 [Saprospiraceae bacterium]|nr:hypothetical protein [Saprospiraceae bacterium]MDP4699438.1 hypothetical protein [Saprospiraceae bacterium]MDP4813733.1 hypothetical protein [Saprospiraceae bacterium]MDP4851715.1 hypothetical protein [Saprospiraceae bacterium]MDP4913760.1 hypothetical protein [Saprospiraceae bacterium]
MKKIFLVAYLLVQSSVFSFSLDLELNQWYDFTGKLDNKSIQLSFYTLKSGKLIGSFCSITNEPKVLLSGNVIGNEIYLTASLNGKTTDELSGKIFTDDQDRLEVSWRKMPNGVKSIFKAVLSSVTAGTEGKRYSHIVGSDAAVEEFVYDAKKAISKGDKIWLAANLFYPIKVRISEKSSVVLKNKNQFLLQYDKIFTTAFKSKLNNTFSHNLFNNYQGVMIGNGEIWINNTLNASEAKPIFQIIAINP